MTDHSLLHLQTLFSNYLSVFPTMLFTKFAVAAGLFTSSALALTPATRMERHQRSFTKRTDVDAASVSSVLCEVKTNIETIGSDLAGKLAALPTQTVANVAGLVVPAVQVSS
jgi:hypothetical protein